MLGEFFSFKFFKVYVAEHVGISMLSALTNRRLDVVVGKSEVNKTKSTKHGQRYTPINLFVVAK